ncbi:hypothetical protein SASPL_128659 [Salvia splendens]|uniref:DUF7950 domain-containing protein n=1 Tax=Salvia splendens TaxID=180675 RepID=A0A8X8ZMA3_SALSN|nr:uncharacterized protein LOC121752609 [Salvia splendens]KAG6410597.1 hypothetical protein SASPL_128659 [Salvia splendens]
MDHTGGCCIARYAGGAYDISKVDRIMRRFRPIAPKPASTNGSVSGGGSSSSASPESSGAASMKTSRRKRRHAVKDGSCGRKKRRCSPEKKDIKTLSLLPEAPGVREPAAAVSSKPKYPLWLSFENGGRQVERREVAASWVKVECVTNTWMGDLYPYGDGERVRRLEGDACPGFVTDGLRRVRWTNPAYRRMAAGEGEVVVEEGVALPARCAGFTCKVRVVTGGNEKASKTVPCDVWRMECGGFAWRLDTAAALSLWIGN